MNPNETLPPSYIPTLRTHTPPQQQQNSNQPQPNAWNNPLIPSQVPAMVGMTAAESIKDLVDKQIQEQLLVLMY